MATLEKEVPMGEAGRGDLARQAANVVGAIFQVGATAFLATGIQEEVEGGTPLIEPALYAFFVWGVIFFLSLTYAAYQALPSRRESPLLRRVGWFTAATFFCIGLWSVFVPAGLLLPALAMLSVSFVCLLVAYLRLARSGRDALGPADRWLVAPTAGIFLGWMTAANAVSLDSEAVRFELVEGGSTDEAVLGAILLLLGGLAAAAISSAGKPGPRQGYLAYTATVLWALVAIVVNQYDASLITTGAATVAAVVVAASFLVSPRGDGGTPSGADAGRPRAV